MVYPAAYCLLYREMELSIFFPFCSERNKTNKNNEDPSYWEKWYDSFSFTTFILWGGLSWSDELKMEKYLKPSSDAACIGECDVVRCVWNVSCLNQRFIWR